MPSSASFASNKTDINKRSKKIISQKIRRFLLKSIVFLLKPRTV